MSRKKLKEDVLNSARALLKGIELVFKAFESGIFLKPEELLPIALAQIKVGNDSESLLK